MFSVVHVTHEAVHKVGGIGTVLEGLINSRPYRDRVARTVLVCPIFFDQDPEPLGPGGIVEYSARDSVRDGPYVAEFRAIEEQFRTRIIYGHRPVEDAVGGRRTVCEVLLIDVRDVHPDRVNDLKRSLWENHGLQSHRHEHAWDFEQYVRLAAPAVPALAHLKLGAPEQPAVVLAHEFMGIPTALALLDAFPRAYRCVFHAHETATIRRIVEAHPGHDRMFYNALELAQANRLYVHDVFGPQHDYFKHALIETTRDFDATLAVGHLVAPEIRFLGSEFERCDIAVAYNGIPAVRCTADEKRHSRALLDEYCESLLGWRPDLIFSHVTRLAKSKALWRDLDVLRCLDAHLVRTNRRAVFFAVSTELPRRPVVDVLRMEEEWDWPLVHREGPPDLTAGEAEHWRNLARFNTQARNVRAVFINQFGFENPVCGRRMPAGMNLTDLRRATSLELGLSLYEPFGISPLEPLTYGSLCAISSTSGCAGLVQELKRECPNPNVLIADFVHSDHPPRTIGQAVKLGAAELRAAERVVAEQLARRIAERLDDNAADGQRAMREGYELASRMSWDAVAARSIMPALEATFAKRRLLSVA